MQNPPVIPKPPPLLTLNQLDLTLCELAEKLETGLGNDVLQVVFQAEAYRTQAHKLRFHLKWQNRFCDLRLRGMRRLGEMIRDMPKHRGGRPAQNPYPANRSFEDEPLKLIELGISYSLSGKCQKIARAPFDVFEAYLAQADESQDNPVELSLNGLLAYIKRHTTDANLEGTTPAGSPDGAASGPGATGGSKSGDDPSGGGGAGSGVGGYEDTTPREDSDEDVEENADNETGDDDENEIEEGASEETGDDDEDETENAEHGLTANPEHFGEMIHRHGQKPPPDDTHGAASATSELKCQNDELKARIADLEVRKRELENRVRERDARIDELESRVRDLERQNSELKEYIADRDGAGTDTGKDDRGDDNGTIVFPARNKSLTDFCIDAWDHGREIVQTGLRVRGARRQHRHC